MSSQEHIPNVNDSAEFNDQARQEILDRADDLFDRMEDEGGVLPRISASYGSLQPGKLTSSARNALGKTEGNRSIDYVAVEGENDRKYIDIYEVEKEGEGEQLAITRIENRTSRDNVRSVRFYRHVSSLRPDWRRVGIGHPRSAPFMVRNGKIDLTIRQLSYRDGWKIVPVEHDSSRPELNYGAAELRADEGYFREWQEESSYENRSTTEFARGELLEGDFAEIADHFLGKLEGVIEDEIVKRREEKLTKWQRHGLEQERERKAQIARILGSTAVQ